MAGARIKSPDKVHFACNGLVNQSVSEKVYDSRDRAIAVSGVGPGYVVLIAASNYVPVPGWV